MRQTERKNSPLGIVWFCLGLGLCIFSWTANARAADSDLEKRVRRLEKQLEREKESADFRVYWKNGLLMDSKDKRFRFKIGGRLQLDTAFFDAGPGLESVFGPQPGGTEFRRARIFLAGLLYGTVKFKAQFDFAGGSPAFKDVYMGLVRIPAVGNIIVGHFKEPYSLEELTSSRFITFLERSLLNETFTPGRNVGIALRNSELSDRLTWAVGVFRDTPESPPDIRGDGEYAITLRLTGVPWREEEGRKLVHLGAAFSHRSPENGRISFAARPEAHIIDARFVDTGTLISGDVNLFNAEAAVVYGPVSVQGEYTAAMVHFPGTPEANLDGYYVQASWFITGEHRPYKNGIFGRVKPGKNFADGKGPGAWQVAVRYSQVDLNDPAAGVRGGFQENITAALNWYLNPHTRLMFNYVNADPSTATGGELNVAQLRFQIDF